jgi:biliverdin reductase
MKVGIVGTGYAAKQRAEALQQDGRSQLLFVAGHTPENTAAFCQTYAVCALDSWQALVQHPDLDLVVVCNVNRDRAPIVTAALAAGKHVIVEYPLALDPQAAASAIALAQQQEKLLHVEHIELLGGLHQAIRQSLPDIGTVFYARYATLTPQHPAPRRWTYHSHLFGFPLSAALSRIHRLTDLFGTVTAVTCQARFWEIPTSDYFRACLCAAQLKFANGVIAEVIYGKGETIWKSDRTFEIHGDHGTLLFDGEQGTLIQANQQIPLEVGSRRGLFAKDTQMVLDRLLEGKPLYVQPSASLYALQVADAALESVKTGTTVFLSHSIEQKMGS